MKKKLLLVLMLVATCVAVMVGVAACSSNTSPVYNERYISMSEKDEVESKQSYIMITSGDTVVYHSYYYNTYSEKENVFDLTLRYSYVDKDKTQAVAVFVSVDNVKGDYRKSELEERFEDRSYEIGVSKDMIYVSSIGTFFRASFLNTK